MFSQGIPFEQDFMVRFGLVQDYITVYTFRWGQWNYRSKIIIVYTRQQILTKPSTHFAGRIPWSPLETKSSPWIIFWESALHLHHAVSTFICSWQSLLLGLVGLSKQWRGELECAVGAFDTWPPWEEALSGFPLRGLNSLDPSAMGSP